MQYPVFKKIIQKQKRKPSRPTRLKNSDRVLYVRGLFNPPRRHKLLDERQVRVNVQWQSLMSMTVLSTFTVMMVLISVVGEYGLLSTNSLVERKNLLEQQIDELKNNELLMLEEIYALKNSPEYIEALTRQELGFVRMEEKIYLLPTLSNPEKLLK